MKIAIIGGGSWGTALAVHLAKNKHQIKVWEFFKEQAEEMEQKRFCRLLPEAKLAENIFVSWEMNKVLVDCELVLLVVPSDKIESTMKNAKALLKSQPIIICAKGLGSNLRLLSEVVKENYPGEIYCLYGPTHAEEVCKGMFSGMVLAGGKGKEKLQKAICSKDLKVELSEDIIGVQVCASLKNIFAIFIGIVDGMQLGDNAKAYLMTKGLGEMKEIGLKWGAKEETFDGLAGMGDLIVTCTSQHSRNRYVGEQIGKGRKLDEILAEMKMVAEGVTTLKTAVQLENKFSLKLPLINGLYQILFEGKDARRVLEEM